MTRIPPQERYKIGRNVTIWGIAVNFGVMVAKYAAGFLGRSQALMADATHSLGDLLTDFVTLWGLKVSVIPKDMNHPFGHGKIETIASSIVGMGLLGAGFLIGWHGIEQCFKPPSSTPAFWALGVAVFTLVAKEALFRYTYHYGKKINSKAVLANAYDHRSDALSSLATVIGIGGAMMGVPLMDPLAAAVVAVLILKSGFSITMEATMELAETSVPEPVLQKIREVALHAEGVVKIGEVRARHVGPSIAINIDIFVKPDLTVRQGHDIADQVEVEILHHMENAGVITVHIEPA